MKRAALRSLRLFELHPIRFVAIPRSVASARNELLSALRIRVLVSHSVCGNVGTVPHWRTQTDGATCFTTSSSVSRTCGARCEC